MRPNTRLLIRFTLEDGAMKGWGYDAQFYKTSEQLHNAIVADFAEWPVNTAAHLFYFEQDELAVANNATDLADEAMEWLATFGVFNGN